MQYNFSKYNVIVNKNKEILLFNTRTLALVTLNTNEEKIFSERDVVKLQNINNNEIEPLLENGFIIPSNISETDILKKEYWDNKINNDILHISIMTTLECNFKCIYCFEKRQNTHLDNITEEKILKFINNNIDNYKTLHIDWYGGEPLLFIELILKLSKEIIRICKEKNVFYYGTITTNGYNLTYEVAKKLHEVGISYAQITIDGPMRIHDKNRMTKNGEGTFNKIISNIQSINKIFNIGLRVNVDKNTIYYVEELLYYLKEAKLLDVNFSVNLIIPNDDNMSCDTQLSPQVFANKVIKIYYKAFELGFKISILSMLKNIKRQFCIVDLDSQYIISPKGELFKCGESFDENDLGKIGILDNYGEAKIDRYKEILWQKDPFSDDDCIACNVLPICMGGCRMKRLTKKLGWCSAELKFCLEEIIYLYYLTLQGEKNEEI